MTDAEIRQARFDSEFLRWDIEDQVRYGSPSNVRVVLFGHPEHSFGTINLRRFDSGRQTPTP